MDKQFAGLWLMTGALIAAFFLFYFQQSNAPLVFAEGRMSDSFIVGACPAPKGDVVFGWGNRAVGRRGVMEIGCFNASAGKIVGVGSLEECRRSACR